MGSNPTRMWFRATVAMALACLTTGKSLAVDNERFCATCNAPFFKIRYRETDRLEKRDVWVCDPCSRIKERCEICSVSLPEKGRHKIADGRYYCDRDYKTLVMEQKESEELFKEVRREVSRMLNHWGGVNDDGIVLTLVDKDEFLRQYRASPSVHNPELVNGLTRSKETDKDKFQHDIFVLNGLRKEQFLAVAAHEYTHAWLAERQLKARTVHHDTVEGFCELIAWKLMDDHHDPLEKERIDENSYTRGQITALRSAEDAHRFYRVVDWILNGVDGWLEADKLDRIFVLRDEIHNRGDPTVRSADAGQLKPLAQPVAPPDRLILRGVLGTGASGRTALINDALFKVNESARVRIGTSNVVVHCLEIHANSVVVQVEGTAEKQELSLTTK